MERSDSMGFIQIAHTTKETLFDLLFPFSCVECGVEGEVWCAACRCVVRTVPPSCVRCGLWTPAGSRTRAGRTCTSCKPHSSIYAYVSPYLYDAPSVRELVHRLKYQRVRAIAPLFGACLADAFTKAAISLSDISYIVPISLHPARERTRGFNQSGLIADEMSRLTGCPVRNNVLRRRRRTAPQVECSGEERLANVRDAFAVADPLAVHDAKILLLDDVKTTGATLEEAARVLKGAGAKRVWAATVAH